MKSPAIAITMGDPSGVGAEVVVKALYKRPTTITRVVIGSIDRLRMAARCAGIDITIAAVDHPDQALPGSRVVYCIDPGVPTQTIPFGKVSAAGGEAAYRYLEIAARMAMEGTFQAIVTAPLNKEALHAAGHIFPGHTEMLAHMSGTPEVSMMLMAPRLRVIHVTTHIGLRHAIERIGVCGINPHAGENGLFGEGEEEQKIQPAILNCRADGLLVEGPLPADTLFFLARRGDYDLVVAMYHDQGHGPVKVLGLEAGVNITIGLPFVRTSVDHGTAFDIAGKGTADEQSLLEAIDQALVMIGAKAS
jgi:4-hydroxythreonine-4-phosphate dehydrogenase